MIAFYRSLLLPALKILDGILGLAGRIIFIAVVLVWPFSARLGQALDQDWIRLVPGWGAAGLCVLYGYALLRANYDKFVAVERERDAAEAMRGNREIFDPVTGMDTLYAGRTATILDQTNRRPLG